jgi:hypothetical protein
MRREVMMADMAILTMVLPKRIVVRHLMGFSRSFKIREVLLPACAILLNFMESRENKAVSAAEKNAENANKRAKSRNLRSDMWSIIRLPEAKT